jgi:PhnB protein
MAQALNPYLNFRDTARHAMEFYKSIFGGELTMNTFGEFGQSSSHPGSENLIMHSQLDTPSGFKLMGADTPPDMEHEGPGNITVSLSGDDDAAPVR